MRNIIYITGISLSVMILSACEGVFNKTVHGSGDILSMEVEVPGFDGISITGTCNVNVQIGASQSVEFFAQSEILDVLSYEVEDGILEIGIKNGYSVSTSKEIRAEITIPGLQFLGVTGAGDYTLTGALQDRLDIYVTGVGDVDAYDMPVNTCNIRISGTGTCKVHVIEELDVVISGVGNIWYRGNPDINSDISGVGNLFPDGNQ